MKSRTLINLVAVALVITVIAVLVISLWMSAHYYHSFATVSWNG